MSKLIFHEDLHSIILTIPNENGEEISNQVADGNKEGEDGGIAPLHRVQQIRHHHKQIQRKFNPPCCATKFI